jgi:hypothetical protein
LAATVSGVETLNSESTPAFGDDVHVSPDAGEREFTPVKDSLDAGGWQDQPTVGTGTPSELHLSSPLSESSDIEKVSQKVDSPDDDIPHLETLQPLEELEVRNFYLALVEAHLFQLQENKSSHCGSSCCCSPPEITALPEDSPSTWQSVPSNRGTRSPVPFVESESQE